MDTPCQGRTTQDGCKFEVRLTKIKEGMWNTSYVNLAHNCASSVFPSNATIKALIAQMLIVDPQVK